VSRLIRIVLVALLPLPAAVFVGCGPSKSEGQPNPDLKTPDVPSGDRGKDKGGGMSQPGKK